ncbi:MAG TPA: pyrroline-5-carboxylate reductase, partial [Candidatus Acetothermia bacterium]|nr:pyrroline-5-carboxylate reductase [Candidatus Acetothermia bacterium]
MGWAWARWVSGREWRSAISWGAGCSTPGSSAAPGGRGWWSRSRFRFPEGGRMLEDKRIAVVGLGTIGTALVQGLLDARKVPPERLSGSTAHQHTAQAKAEKLGIRVVSDNRALVREADVVVVAVKPKTVPQVLSEVGGLFSPDKLLISVAAATPTAALEARLPAGVPVVRAMPNTPCRIGQGMTALCPGRHAGPEHLALAQEIFSGMGQVARIEDESLMEVVTALSGSGPAYAYLIIEALAEGGVKLGLPRRLATQLAA